MGICQPELALLPYKSQKPKISFYINPRTEAYNSEKRPFSDYDENSIIAYTSNTTEYQIIDKDFNIYNAYGEITENYYFTGSQKIQLQEGEYYYYETKSGYGNLLIEELIKFKVYNGMPKVLNIDHNLNEFRIYFNIEFIPVKTYPPKISLEEEERDGTYTIYESNWTHCNTEFASFKRKYNITSILYKGEPYNYNLNFIDEDIIKDYEHYYWGIGFKIRKGDYYGYDWVNNADGYIYYGQNYLNQRQDLTMRCGYKNSKNKVIGGADTFLMRPNVTLNIVQGAHVRCTGFTSHVNYEHKISANPSFDISTFSIKEGFLKGITWTQEPCYEYEHRWSEDPDWNEDYYYEYENYYEATPEDQTAILENEGVVLKKAVLNGKKFLGGFLYDIGVFTNANMRAGCLIFDTLEKHKFEIYGLTYKNELYHFSEIGNNNINSMYYSYIKHENIERERLKNNLY